VDPYDIEIEPEVRTWLDALPREHYRSAERHADRLAGAPTTLGEPHSRHLSGPVRELRFYLGPAAVRLTYWLAPERRIVFLTVFRKTRMREEQQVQRALLAGGVPPEGMRSRACRRCQHVPPDVRGAIVSAGYHTSWTVPEEHRADPAYAEAGAAIALGQAVYDRRTALGLDQPSLARRAGLAAEDIDRIEGGGTPPTLPLLRTLAAALDASLDVSIDTDATRVSFVPHAA
jgi:ribosome-binding protein aMBF1 (putative translation factor)